MLLQIKQASLDSLDLWFQYTQNLAWISNDQQNH